MLKVRAVLAASIVVLAASLLFVQTVQAQGGQTLFGDVHVTTENGTLVQQDITLILRKVPDGEVGRQTISSRGRYRFTNLQTGEYEIVAEVGGKEVGRLQSIMIRSLLSNSPYGNQYDLDFRWEPDASAKQPAGTISAADIYERPVATKSLFEKAQEAVAKKNYDHAIDLLKQVVETDKKDFQAWVALGTVYFAQQKMDLSRDAYQKAIEANPQSERAQLNLGRLLFTEKKFADAVEPLTKAVEIQSTSGDANYMLGECYLQLKKGSKAIPYLNEAANNGRPDAHLRLGWLYNAAGMKDKAAIEYEEYLKKNPTYPDRDKLKEYIAANKKS